MAMQKLADSMAFASGASLWLMPSAKDSIWARRVDWYLNFLAGRAVQHRTPTIDPDFVKLLADEQLKPPTLLEGRKGPLLIASGHRLPAEQAVQIEFNGNTAEWISSVRKVWLDLGKPSARIFLPQGMDGSSLTAAWPEHESASMTVVSSQ